MLRSGEVETIGVHDLVPRRNEVMHELLLGVGTTVAFGQSPELGIGAEDQIDTGAGPLDFASFAIISFK